MLVYRFGSSTRKGRNSVTFAETIATAGVDNTGLSLTAPEQGVLDYPNWLTALENPRYQHSLITTTPTVSSLNILPYTQVPQGQGYQEVSPSSFGGNGCGLPMLNIPPTTRWLCNSARDFFIGSTCISHTHRGGQTRKGCKKAGPKDFVFRLKIANVALIRSGFFN